MADENPISLLAALQVADKVKFYVTAAGVIIVLIVGGIVVYKLYKWGQGVAKTIQSVTSPIRSAAGTFAHQVQQVRLPAAPKLPSPPPMPKLFGLGEELEEGTNMIAGNELEYLGGLIS